MGASKVREWDVSLSHHLFKKTPIRFRSRLILHVGQQPPRRGAERSGPAPAVCSQQTPSWCGEGEKKVIGETRVPPTSTSPPVRARRFSNPPRGEHLRTNERLATTTRDRVLRRALPSLPAGKSTTHGRRHHVSARQRPRPPASAEPWPPAVLLRRPPRRHLPLPRSRRRRAIVPNRGRSSASVPGAAADAGLESSPSSYYYTGLAEVRFGLFIGPVPAAVPRATGSAAQLPPPAAAATTSRAYYGVPCPGREENDVQEEEQEGGAVRVPLERAALQQEQVVGQVAPEHADEGRSNSTACDGAGVGEVYPLVARVPEGVRRDGGRGPDPGAAGVAVLPRGGGRRRRARPRDRDGHEAARRGGGAARGGEGEGQGEQRVQLRPLRPRELPAGVRGRRAAAASQGFFLRRRARTAALPRL
jgi:hypothetical protein